jgi:streptogramin lyase
LCEKYDFKAVIGGGGIMKSLSALKRGVCFNGLISLLLLGVMAVPSLSAAAITVNYFSLPNLDGNNIQRMDSITTGPDGNLWFGIYNNPDAIGRMTTEGEFTIFYTPRPNYNPVNITAGPDGNLWFIGSYNLVSYIGRITPEGDFTEFALPTDANMIYNSTAGSLTAGPDGNLWFTASVVGQHEVGDIVMEIVSMTPAGSMYHFPVPGVTNVMKGITTGPDGNLWFTDFYGNHIGRMTLGGVVTLYTLPTPNSQPWHITASPDGNLWFTECNGNSIGRITTDGVITEYPVYSASSCPTGITPGPDGNIWFTEPMANHGNNTYGKIGHTPVSASNEYNVYNQPPGITVGPDGNIWVVNADYGIDQVTGIGSASLLRLIHPGNPSNTYATFQEAYTAANTGDIIQAQAVALTGPLAFSKAINVTFKGGYDPAFVLNVRKTFVNGSITISSGKVTVENLIIR